MRRELEPGTLALAVPLSQNAKLGDVAATYAAQASCPTDCPFLDGGGCYAESGQLGKFVTAPLNEAARGAEALAIATQEAEKIDALRVVAGRPLRLHVVGDCASDEAARIVAASAERYMERGGGSAFTYTHSWREVERASWGSVSVLASCESPVDVEVARARGYAPSIVVEEFASWKLYVASEEARVAQSRAPDFESGGPGSSDPARASSPVAILPCPAQTHEGVSCSSCGLCFRDERILERGYAIGFELHGIPYAVRQARLALTTPNDPDRRVPSKLRLARFRASFLLEHGREPTTREGMEAVPGLNKSSVWQWLRYLRGEIDHPAETRRRARAA